MIQLIKLFDLLKYETIFDLEWFRKQKSLRIF